MKRRDFMKLGAGLGAAGLITSLTSAPPARAQAKLVFKASDVQPAGYPTVVATENLGKKLAAATQGRLSVQMFASKFRCGCHGMCFGEWRAPSGGLTVPNLRLPGAGRAGFDGLERSRRLRGPHGHRWFDRAHELCLGDPRRPVDIENRCHRQNQQNSELDQQDRGDPRPLHAAVVLACWIGRKHRCLPSTDLAS